MSIALGKSISNPYCYVVNLYKFVFAAKSADRKNGILNLFLSVMGVLMNPGEIREILTLYSFKVNIEDFQLNLFNADFEAP